MDHRYALSSRAQERTKSPHKPTTRDQATESPASFDRQAFHATNGKPGESEASGRHGDTLRDPSIRGISREGSVICVIADDHQLAIFDALDTALLQANNVGYRSYAQAYAVLERTRATRTTAPPRPAPTPRRDAPSTRPLGPGDLWGTRTPIDILYYLFVLANDDAPTAAVGISQVCRRWRAIAVTSPTLWTKITMACVRCQQQHPWTVTRLKRSQNLPISFHLRACRKMTVREVEVLTRHAYRFRCLRILASSYHLTTVLWPQFLQAMSMLEHFEYRIIGGIRFHIQKGTPAPFHLPGASRGGVIEWAKWDTSAITSLVLNYIGPEVKLSVRDFRQIFTHCRHTLMHLEVLGFAPTYDKEKPVPQITLPVLETLSIGYIDNVTPFVELAHTPSLRRLTLRDIIQAPENLAYAPKSDWRFGGGRTDVGRIYELMRGMPLTQLAIFGEQLGYAAEFREFLSALVGLKSLTLYASAEDYYSTLFSTGVFLPSLSDLLITQVDSVRSLAPFFLRRVEAKLGPLRKLTVTNNGVSLIEAEVLLEEIMSGCSFISAITDPVLEAYNVVAEGERDIAVGGIVVM